MSRITHSLPVVLFAVLTVSIPAFAPDPALAADALIVAHRIPAALALKAVGEAVKVCSAEGYTESAVLVDAGGNQQAGLRGDGAGLATLENADHKAYTAVAYKVDTSALVAKAKSGAEMSPALNRLPRLILAPGGVVIVFNHEIIGAIGASGSPFGAKDEACARAGAATITDSLK
ncbi:MAG: heme-binding protein [Candidatus Binataceae bacterium]|jgi:uncharacterized protein GlcG (DUF336 family)